MADISIIVPAHNEEAFLPACLAGIAAATGRAGVAVETIVVLNRCTDRTEAIAREFGAVIIREDAPNLSRIRNAGGAAATSPVLVTCDADSVPHPRTFERILEKLANPRVVGGGTFTRPERLSAGIIASIATIIPYLAWHGVSFGLFWTRTADFRAIGGFNEALVSIEDLDFAKRLRAHGAKTRRRFATLWTAPLVTSCRKFDEFGDWYLFFNPRFVWRIFRGTDREVSNRFWYDPRR